MRTSGSALRKPCHLLSHYACAIIPPTRTISLRARGRQEYRSACCADAAERRPRLGDRPRLGAPGGVHRIAYAAAHALLGPATHLIGGWNGADALNYPDCREPFLAAAEQTLRLATERPFIIVRPLIADDKAAIVRRALALGAPIHLTWTCYLGGDRACGTCDACQLRVGAFRQIGVIDPVPYASAIDWSGCAPYRRP